MRVKFVAGFVSVVAAALLFGALAVPAMAEQSISLAVTPAEGAFYGETVDLQPVVETSTVLPGDLFNMQVLQGSDWVNFGEQLAVEDTGVVPAQSIVIGYDDQAFTYPARFRTVFLPKSSGNTTDGVSAATTVTALRFSKSTLTVTVAKKVRHAGTRFSFRVSPVSGPGRIRVTIAHRGVKTKTVYFTTSEYGRAYRSVNLGTHHGLYKVTSTFMGDRFAPKSKSVVKTVRAYR